MAKIEKASDDLVKLFDGVRNKTGIPQWVIFEVLCNDKQKELYKINKSNDVVELLTGGVNFAVIFNEEILDQLPMDLQEIAITECLGGIHVSENDTVLSEKTNFNTHTGVLQKYGHEPIILLHESIKSLYDAKKQKEDEEKASSKVGKGRRKKNK